MDYFQILLGNPFYVFFCGMNIGIVLAILVFYLNTRSKPDYGGYPCPHGYTDSDDCPDCRH